MRSFSFYTFGTFAILYEAAKNESFTLPLVSSETWFHNVQN